MSDLLGRIGGEFVFFDGAMGTMLQKSGLGAGELPELLNISHPQAIIDIHRQYVRAGSDIVTANTFGACGLKLKGSGYTVEQVVTAAIRCAKASGARYTALDIGPTGRLLEPAGALSFGGAYELFKEQVIAARGNGADLVLIETMSDLYEMKAAILAVKENSDLPVFCTMTFQKDMRTFMGCDPLTAIVVLEGLGADAIGINCSLGPEQLAPAVEEYAGFCGRPIILQPNAGLPKGGAGDTRYDVTPGEYAGIMSGFARRGVSILGGCCGTTPEHIRQLKASVAGLSPARRETTRITAAASGSRSVIIGEGLTIIGERINPTGKKKLKEALKLNNMDYILGEAISQAKASADILDVNCGLPDIDESVMLARMVREIQSVANLPLQIDSADAGAIEGAVRVYNGKPVINSVNGTRESVEQIFPIAKKYGALVVGLTLDERGIPETARERFEIAKFIVESAEQFGVTRENILIDCLVLTASAQQEQILETLKAISLVKSRLGVKTVLGVSNVSFGLPRRELLNAAFLSMACGAGLDAAILNPLSDETMDTVSAIKALNRQDNGAAGYISRFAGDRSAAARGAAEPGAPDLKQIVIDGRTEEAAALTTELIKTRQPLEIINDYFVPALDIVGERYEKGELFLPQLMRSAQAVQAAFSVIRDKTRDAAGISKGKIVVATVRGDIHDIGKNIAKMLLQNYGYDVIDLGRDVPAEEVVGAVLRDNIKLVGLSALMTTTLPSMKRTIELLREQAPDCKVMAGGAVLNEEFVEFVGAGYYAKDAREGVKIAAEVFGRD